jgi:hypothetical protein
MPFPETSRIELPILLELKAAGGADQPRYLYDRLVQYFPQITSNDLTGRTDHGWRRWRMCVQRAGKQLEILGQLRRQRLRWELTAHGLKRAEDEALHITAPAGRVARTAPVLSHRQAQTMLLEIGQMFGRHAEIEYETYDVIWRESVTAPRISHVFEVQISGNVDSALSRLKRAYDAQRSQIYLVIADERDKNFARKRLSGPFHELWDALTVIGTGELERLYDAMKRHEPLLGKFANRN